MRAILRDDVPATCGVGSKGDQMNAFKRLWLLAAVAGLAMPATALAETVVVMPFSQKNTSLPHPAHEGAHMTLKAYVRDAACNNGYFFSWDVNRNGNYDDDWRGSTTRDGNNTLWEITRTYLVPAVDRDTSYNINVRVTNRCNNENFFGTFRLFIYDWRPSNDPRDWTREQLEIMGSMAANESLWYLHRSVNNRNERNTNRMWGQNPYHHATGLALWFMVINGHMPAYPPNTIQWHGMAEPEDFDEQNDARWAADPLAESSVRMLNFLTRIGNLQGIPGGEESNQCGYNNNQQAVTCNRIAGTTDNRGAYAGGDSRVYVNGVNTGGLSPALAVLGNTPIQHGGGSINGQPWQWYIQQMVDKLGGQQIDGAMDHCSMGGWLYNDWNGNGHHCGWSDGSTTQWAYIGLESAAVAGEQFGVFVNNRHKYRIGNNLVRNQRGDGGAGYRSNSGRGDLKLTGGAIVGSRWLGVHTFNRNDNTNPFPNEQSYSRGRLREAYDTYLAYTSRVWNEARSVGSHWADSMWELGDPLCGNTNAIHNVSPRCGSTYGMYSHQKGFRTGAPELERIGNHDWFTEFTTYYVRAQRRTLNAGDPRAGLGDFGQIRDDYCANHSVTCVYGAGNMSAAMGGLVLTPTIFKPKPVAIAAANPPEVTEGCAGGNNGRVTFDHSDSFHPSDSDRIVAFQWDVDSRNGLWWDNNNDPDYNGRGDGPGSYVYTYQRAGVYTATLRVVDTGGQTKQTTVQVRVNEADNVPPSAAHGGPYVAEVNQNVQLRGRGTDQNLGCGDTITIAWDIDGIGDANDFADAAGATPTLRWDQIQNLPRERAIRIRMRVRDEAGESDVAETTLTIYPRDPVAVARANPPNPVSCPQEVTFDGSRSSHPNPQRTIAQYAWDVDGDGDFDGGGQQFRHTYDEWGNFEVTLRVTDDLGRTDETTIRVEVSGGNQAPVARVSQANYVVLEGDDLVLDGRASTDANASCGDEIAEFAWDIDGDGEFGGANDLAGSRVTIEWADLVDLMDWPADRNSGEPFNTVTLRVTDSRGAAGTVQARVTIFSALPIAEVRQNPDPSPISLRNGFSRTALDGRESRSPVPNGEITAYSWDLDDNGEFEVANRAVVDFVKVFDPIPNANNIPATFVRLRVTDGENRNSRVERYRINYRVPPTQPTADADPTDPPERGYHILLGQGVELDGSQSSDPDSEEFDDFLQFFRWDLTYDEDDGFDADFVREDADGGDQDGVAVLALTAQQLAGAGVDAAGDYVVRLQVEDSTELTNEDSAPLHVYAVNPVADVTANPNPSACRERVSFDARGSNHPHPAIAVNSWTWDLDGDGAYDDANGAQVNHAFLAFGTYEVGLRVGDDNGGASTTSVEVVVNQGNRAPTSVAGGFRNGEGVVTGPYAIAVGESLQLDGAGSADPDANCEDRIVNYQWDVGDDGDFDIEGENARRPAALSWADLVALGIDEPGSYDIRMRVSDRFGLASESTATLRVVVGPTARATANPQRTGCQNQVAFDGSQSSTDGPDGQGFGLASYTWDFDGDGECDDGEGQRVTRPVAALPGDNGRIAFEATLCVEDQSGRVDTDDVSVEIDVQNLPPVANAGGPYATGRLRNGFAPVRLDARGSSDPNEPCDELSVFKWDTDGDGRFGRDDEPDDLVGEQVEYANNAWQVNTTETVRLIVCDAAGLCSNPDEADIEIGAEAPPHGEVVSPRGADDFCVGRGNFNVVANVSDPEGDNVTVTVVVNGEEVGERQVDTPDNGDAVEVTIAVNANNIAEGAHFIEIHLDDGNGGEAVANSGARIPFDRTAPEVDIGRQPTANVCYAANQVPDAEPSAEDNLDDSPSLSAEVVEEGCGRTLVVTATDSCGNEGVARRTYLIAQQAEIRINGANEGALVAEARMSWEVVGPAGCGRDITARLARNGAGAQNYPANQLINVGGNYALTVSVANCQGVRREFIRNFAVNVGPTAIPMPGDHPQAHADADPDAEDERAKFWYGVAEGAGLQLDGRDSLAPEEADEIESFSWDFEGDDLDVQGQLAAFDTSEDGTFDGVLTVEDSLGASDQANFRVSVADVDPTANPGGPYVVNQGQELRLDGRGSAAGSNADPISNFVWEWGDGTANSEGAALTQPTHTWAANGNYNVRLTVTDEDSSDSEVVRVEVRDVNPVIESVDQPDDPYEIVPMELTANATAGAPGDPITLYEWDFNNDGEVDLRGAELNTVQWQFKTAGRHTVTVRVRDRDSAALTAINVDVRPITLAELLAWIKSRIQGVLASDDYNLQQKFPLNGSVTFADNGLWAEAAQPRRRGTALIASDKLITRLRQAQGRGVDFGLEMWALARTLKREVENLRAAIDDDEDLAPYEPAFERADDFIEQVGERFDGDDFEDDARSDNRHSTVQELWSDSFEAYFHLRDSVEVYNEQGRYALPPGRDPVQLSAAGDDINGAVVEILEGLQADMQAYVESGDDDTGPGRAEISDAIEVLTEIRTLQRKRVINPCPAGEENCVTDEEALTMEILAMDLVRALTAAANRGAYTRLWQQHLVLLLKFRIELSILRVEFLCGRFSRDAQLARDRQETGLGLVNDGNNNEALAFYIHNDTKCLIVEVYNGCVVDAEPEADPIDVPDECVDEDEGE